jgi:hypothetical protein
LVKILFLMNCSLIHKKIAKYNPNIDTDGIQIDYTHDYDAKHKPKKESHLNLVMIKLCKSGQQRCLLISTPIAISQQNHM